MYCVVPGICMYVFAALTMVVAPHVTHHATRGSQRKELKATCLNSTVSLQVNSIAAVVVSNRVHFQLKFDFVFFRAPSLACRCRLDSN